jgi:hypothetical protein
MQVSNIGGEIRSRQLSVGYVFAGLLMILQQTEEFLSELFCWFKEPN